jgi:hypothetical protein
MLFASMKIGRPFARRASCSYVAIAAGAIVFSSARPSLPPNPG